MFGIDEGAAQNIDYMINEFACTHYTTPGLVRDWLYQAGKTCELEILLALQGMDEISTEDDTIDGAGFDSLEHMKDEFKDKSVEEIIETLNRWFPNTINYKLANSIAYHVGR